MPSGKRKVVFTLSGGTGNADLYVQLATRPTTTVYGCRSVKTKNAEKCTITAPAAGDYYMMLNGVVAFSGATLKGTYS